MINITAKIETKKIIEKINETKSCFFFLIDKSLARIIKRKGEGSNQ